MQIVHLLLSAGRPMPAGEIVGRVHIGQSTVSHHLAVPAETRFVLAELAGSARLYRLSDATGMSFGIRPAVPRSLLFCRVVRCR